MIYGRKHPVHPVTRQLRAARQQQGLSQKDMVVGIGLNFDVVTRIEMGQVTNPHLWSVTEMAASLGKAIRLEDEEEWW